MSEQLYKKILLPTDGSKYSDISEKHALSIAATNNSEINTQTYLKSMHYQLQLQIILK